MARAKAVTPRLTNAELWEAARALSPTFAAHTSKGTSEFFGERGWSEIEATGITQTLNEFYSVIMPYYLNIVNISHARDLLQDADVGEYWENEYGEYAQRMAVNSIKPLTPAYRNLKNGDSPDPYVVYKPTMTDRFYRPNFDYQSLVTIPDDWMTKRIFSSQYGFSELLAGIYQGLENGWVIQRYLNKLEVINAGINDTKLQPTQTVSVPLPAEATELEIVNFILAVKNTISQMETQPQTSAYNALGFADTQDKSRLRLLVRAGWKNRVDLIAARNSYNRDVLNIDIPTVEVANFGGLEHYVDAEYTQPAYPVYDELGHEIGFSATQGSTTAELTNTYVKDPNEGVLAILMDKGWLFEIRQNPYVVEPIRNPRGRYTNHWASSPNNTIAYDRLYTFVKFVNSEAG